MKIYGATFPGERGPGAAVVLAEDEEAARALLWRRIVGAGLDHLAHDVASLKLAEIPTDEARAFVLTDGDY